MPSAPLASSLTELPPASPGPALRAGQSRPNAYALVIGVEKYRDAAAPPGARSDAQQFAALAKTTLGVPADHVILALDDRASKSDIEKHLSWLSSNVPTGGRVYFFFAGHGAPDPTSQSAFLLPYDGDPKLVGKTGIALNTIMSELNATKAQEIVAFVDTCYSGAGGRSVLPPGARALVRVVEPTVASAPRIALLSSAGASEISGPIAAGTEGLFTHTLVEGIGTGSADMDGDGNISLGEVAVWVKPRVAREAKKDSRDQTPTLTIGKAAGDPHLLMLVSGIVK